ncbi:MAG: hypothetical protein QOG31_225 [Thermoplasmata archaeon]|nr:hypothetical protein [Thermoplasmata archaeon]
MTDDLDPRLYARHVQARPVRRLWLRARADDVVALNHERQVLQLTWPDFVHYLVLQLRREARA